MYIYVFKNTFLCVRYKKLSVFNDYTTKTSNKKIWITKQNVFFIYLELTSNKFIRPLNTSFQIFYLLETE